MGLGGVAHQSTFWYVSIAWGTRRRVKLGERFMVLRVRFWDPFLGPFLDPRGPKSCQFWDPSSGPDFMLFGHDELKP